MAVESAISLPRFEIRCSWPAAFKWWLTHLIRISSGFSFLKSLMSSSSYFRQKISGQLFKEIFVLARIRAIWVRIPRIGAWLSLRKAWCAIPTNLMRPFPAVMPYSMLTTIAILFMPASYLLIVRMSTASSSMRFRSLMKMHPSDIS